MATHILTASILLLIMQCTSTDGSPVLLFGAERTARPSLNIISKDEFTELMRPLLDTYPIVIFIAQNLTAKDFIYFNPETKDICLSNIKEREPRSYYANVESPLAALEALDKDAQYVQPKGPYERIDQDICKLTGKVRLLVLKHEGGLDVDSLQLHGIHNRVEMLAYHDLYMENFNAMNDCPIACFYLALMGTNKIISFEEGEKREETAPEEPKEKPKEKPKVEPKGEPKEKPKEKPKKRPIPEPAKNRFPQTNTATEGGYMFHDPLFNLFFKDVECKCNTECGSGSPAKENPETVTAEVTESPASVSTETTAPETDTTGANETATTAPETDTTGANETATTAPETDATGTNKTETTAPETNTTDTTAPGAAAPAVSRIGVSKRDAPDEEEEPDEPEPIESKVLDTPAPEPAIPAPAIPETTTPKTASPVTATSETPTPAPATTETATPNPVTSETSAPEPAAPAPATPDTVPSVTDAPETVTKPNQLITGGSTKCSARLVPIDMNVHKIIHERYANNLHLVDITLQVTIKIDSGESLILMVSQKDHYFILKNVTYKDTVYRRFEDISTIFHMSYFCGKLVLYSKDGCTLTFKNIQYQGFEHERRDRQPHFSEAWHCTGYFSIGIAQGIFVMSFIISMVFIGIVALMDLQTMSNFENPDGKPLVIRELD